MPIRVGCLAVVLVLAVAAAPSQQSAAVQTTAAFDLVVEGGRVLDGSGNPYFYADVGVRDGRIAAIGRLAGARATRRIDATGKFVTPGFIDLHSHSDGGIDSMPLRYNLNMIAQGITLSVVNQDGRSPWPIRNQKALYEKQGIGNNVALMIGHGAVRSRVMTGRTTQFASDADIQAMQKLVVEGMEDGAYGLSTGLEYNPGRYSETREVVEITRPVKPYGGFYISHERAEGPDPMWKFASDPTPTANLVDAVNETITIGRETGVPVVASHLKAKGVNYWGSSVVATRLIREAREMGHEVYADQYPYETSGSDGSTVLIPSWITSGAGGRGGGRGGAAAAGRGGAPGAPAGPGAAGGPKEALRARLAIPADNAKVRTDIQHEINRRGGPERIVITDFPDARYVQKSLDAIAKDLKLAPVDAAIWLQMNGADRLGGARMRGFSLSEIDIDHIMQQDFTATCTDGDTVAFGQGTPHARFYGTMPRKIRRYVFDRGVITLPFAIRSMTSLPAQIMGLKDRGTIRTGYWADLVIFDPATIADKATFTDPHQYPAGIPYVFVNGVAVVDNGKFTQTTPGRVLTPRTDSWRYGK
jgi:N-acyl-D-amino-acid deacylase